MKRIYILSIFLLFAITGFSQTALQINKAIATTSVFSNKTVTVKNKPEAIAKPYENSDANIVTVLDIGTSQNAIDFINGYLNLWTNNDLNTVSFFHMMGGSLDSLNNVGNYGYDISFDGGQNWNLMNNVFNTDVYSGSHAFHAIYNPSENNDIDNAYLVYNMPANDGNIEGFINGQSNLTNTDDNSFNFTQNNQLSNSNYAFDLTQNGDMFVVMPLFSDAMEYIDTLLVKKGVWNESTNSFDFTSTKIEALVNDDLGAPLDVKIAFDEEGAIGYISIIANNGMAQQQSGFTNLYPIYWKTIDGGESWSDPEFIQLDGSQGLQCIVNHQLTDEQIYDLFGDNPPERTEISYTTAFDHDIAVDQNGNINIAVVIGPTGQDSYSIISQEDYIVVWDFIKESNWVPIKMGNLHNFRGTFGDFTEDNRIRISKNQQGRYVFVSWLDSDLEGMQENNQPNIFCRGLDISTKQLTSSQDAFPGPFNVTLFSDGMWKAYFGTAADYVMQDGNGFYIPFVYAEFDDDDFTQTVQFKYISDFYISDYDFDCDYSSTYCDCDIEGINYENKNEGFNCSITPNPIVDNALLKLNLPHSADVKFEIYDEMGKTIFNRVFENMPQGTSSIEINIGSYKSGMYFYRILIDGISESGKIVLKTN